MILSDGRVELKEGMGLDGDLVKIIKTIQDEMSTGPKPTTPAQNNLTNYLNSYNHNRTKSDDHDLSLIESLSDEQVNNLLADDEMFGKFMKNFKHIEEERGKRLEAKKAEALEKCKNNLSLKKEINALASKLDETHENYSQISQSYQNFLVLNASNLTALNPENLITQIQVNLMELNDLSNNYIKQVVSFSEHGNMDLELKECIKLRKEYHKRAILLKKLE